MNEQERTRRVIAELQEVVHAPLYRYTPGERQQARDALVMIHTGLNR